MFHPSDDHPDRPRRARSQHDLSQRPVPHGSLGHYDADQPRVPAGHPDGGQWTNGGYRPLSELAELPAPDLRDADAFRLTPELPRIGPGMYPEYAQARPRKETVWPDAPYRAPPTPSLPPPLGSPRGQIPEIGGLLTLGLGLWWLHRRSLRDDSDNGYSVVRVRARELRLDPNAAGGIAERGLSLEEAEKYCPDLGLVQKILDMARDKVGNPQDFKSTDPGGYGKAVDTKFKELLGKLNTLRTSRGDQRVFIMDETFSWNGKGPFHQNRQYSKTPDALQKRPSNVCTYEVTTEEDDDKDRDGMLVTFVNMTRHESMKGVTDFVMTRLKPSTPPPPPKATR